MVVSIHICMCTYDILLYDAIQLNLHPGTALIFTNNHAREFGGGIYLQLPSLRFVVQYFNRLCFIQFIAGGLQDVPPAEWVRTTVYIRMCVHVHAYVHECVCLSTVCVCVRACVRASVYLSVCVFVHMCACFCLCLCVHVCVYVCVHISKYVYLVWEYVSL